MNFKRKNTIGQAASSTQLNGNWYPHSYSNKSATRKTMIKYSHCWLLFNSATTDNQMIYPYCLRSEEILDHDHFLTCNESEEREEVRIKIFSQLLTQLQTLPSLTPILINGLKLAYQEYHQPTDISYLTQ